MYFMRMYLRHEKISLPSIGLVSIIGNCQFWFPYPLCLRSVRTTVQTVQYSSASYWGLTPFLNSRSSWKISYTLSKPDTHIFPAANLSDQTVEKSVKNSKNCTTTCVWPSRPGVCNSFKRSVNRLRVDTGKRAIGGPCGPQKRELHIRDKLSTRYRLTFAKKIFLMRVDPTPFCGRWSRNWECAYNKYR